MCGKKLVGTSKKEFQETVEGEEAQVIACPARILPGPS